MCIWSSWRRCHHIILCFIKMQNDLPFWCWLSQDVLEKRSLNWPFVLESVHVGILSKHAKLYRTQFGIFDCLWLLLIMPSVLWCCWLGSRKAPVKNWVVGCWHGLGRGADLHMAQLMPLPFTISCSSKFRLVLPSWFHLSGHQDSAGQSPGGRKTVVVVLVA